MVRVLRTKQENGFTVLFAVLVASLVLTIGISIFNITFKELILSSQIRDSQFAFYAADAGLECASFWDRKHPTTEASIFGGAADIDTLSDGLVGYWKLNESGGTSASDSGPELNHGTLNNMVGDEWTGGIVGNALTFDGVDDAVQVSEQGNLYDLTEYSYSFWIRREAGATGISRKVLSKGTVAVCSGASPSRSPAFFLSATNERLTAQQCLSGSTDNVLVTSTGGTPLNTWTHIALTFGSGAMRLYINGVFNRESTYTDTVVNNNNDLYFGTPNNNGMVGSLDEIRIYDRVLTDPEIRALALDVSTFTDPVGPNTGFNCVGADITNPTSEWPDGDGPGWDQELESDAATTSFDLLFDNGYCAMVTVAKTANTAVLESRGYNTCDTNDPRRVERALRVTY